MQKTEILTLKRTIPATVIPAGDVVELPEGSTATISQALGGTLTLRTDRGLFRVTAEFFDALEGLDPSLVSSENLEKEVSDAGGPLTEEQVWEALRGCYDPEIPVNIVDLGLIYDLAIQGKDGGDLSKDTHVDVKMTLTAQGCGMGPVIAEDAKTRIEALPQVASAHVEIVWEPAWTPHMISEVGRQKLGFA